MESRRPLGFGCHLAVVQLMIRNAVTTHIAHLKNLRVQHMVYVADVEVVTKIPLNTCT